MPEGLPAEAARIAGEIVVSDDPGERVRRARTRCGFTQTELAPHLDVRRETLSRIERGRATPSLDVLARFARAIALARHVREAAARLETRSREPDPRRFRAAGARLGLDPERGRDIAADALDAYDTKRRELLEDVTTEENA
jgi:DNA-binding XRE family transcriptional regulator